VALSSKSIRPLMPTPAAWLDSSAPSAASRMYAVPFAKV
jgi:hypothetical protein